jgi:hypothetical protein
LAAEALTRKSKDLNQALKMLIQRAKGLNQSLNGMIQLRPGIALRIATAIGRIHQQNKQVRESYGFFGESRGGRHAPCENRRA